MVWVWVGIWVVLALGAGTVLFLVGRDLWRKAVALAHEMGDAADRLSDAADRIGEHSSATVRDVRSQGSSSRPQR